MTNEIRKCRICGLVSDHPTITAREMMFGTRRAFLYFQCKGCECLQISEIPENLDEFYPENYYSLSASRERKRLGVIHRWLRQQRCKTALFGSGYKLNSLIKPIVTLPKDIHQWQGGLSTADMLSKSGIKNFQANILDVGCGSRSRWLEHLADLGFRKLTGVDPFAESDKHYDGIEIRKTHLTEISGEFDLITFHHSFEHIPLQLETLRAASERLKPGGTCLIRIPIVSSYAWKKYGSNWVELDAPRHLYLHSIESITNLAREANLLLSDIVFDSISLEFYGSEQYIRDIPLNDSKSLWTNPESDIFSQEQKAEFDALSKKVNADKMGGRAGFYFKTERR